MGPIDNTNEEAPPLISVIVRSMDRPSLEQTLASIAGQDWRPLEVVLVNARGPEHGPTPTALADGVPLLRVDTGEPLPRSAAANAGLGAARGDSLIFLDDDDVFLPGHLARLQRALQEHPSAVAAHADVAYGRDEGGEWRTTHVFADEFDRDRLRFENFLPLHAALVRRSAIDTHGCRFDETLDLFEDWDWWLQLSRHGQFIRVPGVSARYVAAADGGSGVFADQPHTTAMRRRLLLKWLALDTPADRVAQLEALRDNFRQARQQADLAASRHQELLQATAQVEDLRQMLAARDRDLNEAAAQRDDLRALVAAREAEVAAAAAQLADHQALVAAREQEVAAGREYTQSLQQVLAARETEISHLRGTPVPELRQEPERTTVFTIVSRNYLHFALNLMDSVGRFLPGTRRTIVLCDAADGLPPMPDGIELLRIDELGIAMLDRMTVQYTILELNTAIKPFVFAHLFGREDAERVVYFDPDIQLYASGELLLRRLDSAEVVLTPHLGAPLDDGKHPSDLAILQSGTYNLGFLALRRSEQTRQLVQWWSRKLERDCVVDIPRGLFTDQKWMDLVPGFCADVHVERDAGWNVAYWNLSHRDVQRSAEAGYRVNGRPLFFFHFSGYAPGSGTISKHQDRFTLANCSPAAQALFTEYGRSVAAHGRERFSRLPYAFATLADGTPLPDCARQLIREQLDWNADLPDLRTMEGAHFLITYLTGPVDGGQPPVSRLALQLHRSRADLQAAFPDVMGTHRRAFVEWFTARAAEEAKVPPVLMAGIAAPPAPAASGSDAAAPRTSPSPATADSAADQALLALPFRAAYALAWNARNLLRPLTTPQFRGRVRSFLVRRAYPPRPAPPAAPNGQVAPLPFGVTVIGYVQAESGVGESARSTLRALASTDVPRSVQDFREGNVSRMGERVEDGLPVGVRHAVSLFHINADQLPHARVALGDTWFGTPYRIGFWAWELEQFPAEWHGAFDLVDEVWVPSAFCQRAVAEHAPVPVLCIPHSVAIPEHGQPDRTGFGLRAGSVVFLAMADVMSSPERKNPFGAIEAFERAFAHGPEPVELVVKVSNGDRDPQAMARLRAMAARDARIHLIEDYLDRTTLNRLIDSVDCFVSLHRAEGFGLVNAEAMVRGKVVIATGWSGNMDFMTAENSLPVGYALQTIATDIGPYRAGQRWAEPDLDDAAEKMRRVAADRPLRERLGQRARADCAAQLSPPVVGRLMATRLTAIGARRGLN
jgi:glycosyltransferase involved in cell wall biosynthesis/GT2 family glycosyltransferase